MKKSPPVFLELGFELFTEPKAGMSSWVRHPEIADANVLALRCHRALHPAGAGGIRARSGLEPSPWLRFNIAFCEDEAVFDFLQQEIARARSWARLLKWLSHLDLLKGHPCPPLSGYAALG